MSKVRGLKFPVVGKLETSQNECSGVVRMKWNRSGITDILAQLSRVALGYKKSMRFERSVAPSPWTISRPQCVKSSLPTVFDGSGSFSFASHGTIVPSRATDTTSSID